MANNRIPSAEQCGCLIACLVRRPHRRHRRLDVALVAVGNLRVDGTRRRVDVVEEATRGRLDVRAVDEVADALHGYWPATRPPSTGRLTPLT